MNSSGGYFYQAIKFSVLFLFQLAVFVPLVHCAQEIPKPFQGDTENSTLTIEYDDISYLLGKAVFDVGQSFRETVGQNRATIGTRLKTYRKVHTALEGNRFDFDSFIEYPDNRKVLMAIRDSLEKLPDETSLSLFTKEEQLAYWLNLYNITLINELLDYASNSVLNDHLYGESSILDKKILTVSDIRLSLNDIQFSVVNLKFKDQPLVMYGFYQGIIGSPNIRKTAYTGKNVYQQLRDNAVEFVNSNRGLRINSQDALDVSSLYDRNKDLFPNFNVDLKRHLLELIDEDYHDTVAKHESFEPIIKDTHIANIVGGERKFGGSAATSAVALMGSAINEDQIPSVMLGQISADTAKNLIKLKTNRNLRKGEVTISEELNSDSNSEIPPDEEESSN